MQPSKTIRVLIIEDQTKIAGWLATFLEQAGFAVQMATTGADGLRLARDDRPNVVILDLMLPDMDGMDVCRVLRRDSDMFIIMLTARVEETDRLLGLELGADDYVTKPFSPREVVARIRALLRRANGGVAPGRNTPPKTLVYGALTLDAERRLCSLNDEPIPLTPTEFALLETLMRHPGIPYTRERLINEALGYDYAGLERTIDVHIRNLRRKLESDVQSPQYLMTVFGVGYRFSEDVL